MFPARTLPSWADEDTATSCKARRRNGSLTLHMPCLLDAKGLPLNVFSAALIGRVRADQRDSAVTLSKLPLSESESICRHKRATALPTINNWGIHDEKMRR